MKLNDLRTQQVLIGSFFLIALVYVFKTLNPFLFYYTQQPAFLNDPIFFISHVSYPGGIGQYISLWFVQYFKYPWIGSFIMLTSVALTSLLCFATIKKVFGPVKNRILYSLIPLAISILVWHNVKFPFYINIQILFTLFLIWVSTNPTNKYAKATLLFILSILLYFISGAPYLYLYSVSMALIVLLSNHGKEKFLSFLPIILGIIIPLLFYKAISPISKYHAWFQYAPKTPLFIHYKANGLLYILLAFFPAILGIKFLASRHLKSIDKIKPWVITTTTFILITTLTLNRIKKLDNNNERTLVQMRDCAYRSDWKTIIQLAEKLDKYDRMGNFYINQAMFHTGQMESNLFRITQLLGENGLFVDTPIIGEICLPSSYLYTKLGLLNNALRFAYEAQTLIPNSPYVLMQIIDCLIITKQTDEATYFLSQLNKNRLYRDFVKSRKAFIAGKNIGLNRKFVHHLQKLIPQTDFYTSNPIKNVAQLSNEQPSNKMATSYTLAYYLLQLNLIDFAKHLATFDKLEELKLPKIYQEAVILYLVKSKNPIEKIKKVKISPQVKTRFTAFSLQLKKGKKQAYPILAKNFADTYWFYTIYDNPKVTGMELKTRQSTINH